MTLPDLETLMPESEPPVETPGAAASPVIPQGVAEKPATQNPDELLKAPHERVASVLAQMLAGVEETPPGGAETPPPVVEEPPSAPVVETPRSAVEGLQSAPSIAGPEIYRVASALLATGDPADRDRARRLLDSAAGPSEAAPPAQPAAPEGPEIPAEPDWAALRSERLEQLAKQLERENTYLVETQSEEVDAVTGEARLVPKQEWRTRVDVKNPIVRAMLETRADLAIRDERDAWREKVSGIRSEWESKQASAAVEARGRAVMRSREDGLRAIAETLAAGKPLSVNPLPGEAGAAPVDLGAIVASAPDPRAMAAMLRNTILGAEASEEWQQTVERHVKSGAVSVEGLMRTNPGTGRSYYMDALLQFAVATCIRPGLQAVTRPAAAPPAPSAKAAPAVPPVAVKRPPVMPGPASVPPPQAAPSALPGSVPQAGAPAPVKFPRSGATPGEVSDSIRDMLSGALT